MDIRGHMTPDNDNSPILRSLRLLENDIDALGWDGPPRLYSIEGDLDDPDFKLVGEIPGHPAEALQDLYDKGMRPPVEVHGLAIVTEAWRAITLQEAETVGLIDLTEEREAHKDDWEEYIREAGKAYVENMLKLGPISSFPEQFRIESRNVTAVLRDGSLYVVHHDRDGSTSAYKSEVPALECGRVPEVMAKLLEPIEDGPDDQIWVVVAKNADGTPGKVLKEFDDEFAARRYLVSLPGHSKNLYAYGPKEAMEE